jgi:hypothetical protein
MASGCNDDCNELWTCRLGAAEVTWMVLWKSSCDELWTCECIAAAGSGVYGGLETWTQRDENVWIHCVGRGVTSGWRNVRDDLGMCGLIVALGLAWTAGNPGTVGQDKACVGFDHGFLLLRDLRQGPPGYGSPGSFGECTGPPHLCAMEAQVHWFLF